MAIIRIDYLNPQAPLVSPDGRPTPEFYRWLQDMTRRVGGPTTDAVDNANANAAAALAIAQSIQSGTPTGFTLDPANPLTFTAESTQTATINIAAHTRSTAAAPLAAGTITGLARGFTYHVYYNDPTDAGGVVTYLASTDSGIVAADTANRRFVGSIGLPNPEPSGGGGTVGGAFDKPGYGYNIP